MIMKQIIDFERYPLHELDSDSAKTLVRQCKDDLERDGMFTLSGFIRAPALPPIMDDLLPMIETDTFTHEREHNIYFSDDPPGIEPDHPALDLQKTINHTLCGDQLGNNPIKAIYEWPALAEFLSGVMQKQALFVMDDPLAGVNVLTYYEGEGLNWHFDRSEFTTTILLQAPVAGAEFQYRQNLRSDNNPNYDGVAKLLKNQDPSVESISIAAGDLNVFRGKNTAHKITPVQGDRQRVVSVLSYYETPGRRFTASEQKGFYGRVAKF
jgi:hypothetical protein